MAQLTLVSTTVKTDNPTLADSGDWIYYKAASLERRSGGGSLFSDISYINEQFQGTNGAGNNRQFNWTNGTPTATGTNVTGNRYERSYNSADDSGEVITCRVDSGVRTYKLHVGYYADTSVAQGTIELEVELSDASASPISSFPTLTIGADTEVEFVIDAASATDNQTITFRWRNNATASAVARYVTIRAAEVTNASGGTTIDCNLGTANAIGYNANIVQQTNVDCALGNANALGYQASIDIGLNIDCNLGTANAQGYTAEVTLATNIECNVGAANATGYQATVETSGGTTIDCNLGTADATGYQASITVTSNIDCNLGTATASGYTATITNTAASYGFTQDIQSLTPGALVEFFAIDLNPIGVAEQYYFHNGVNSLGNDVTWQGIVYTRFPIDADGFEWNGTGTQPRPSIRIANITGLIGALCRENEDMVGVKVTRKRTFLQYIDAVNFASGNPMADPNVHAPDEIWYIDRKVAENRVYVEWELRAGSDLTGKFLPARQCIQNTCLWKVIGGYRGANCSYTGPAVADANDVPTNDMALDNCGGRLSSCRLRFPQGNPIPFGGYPAIGLIK